MESNTVSRRFPRYRKARNDAIGRLRIQDQEAGYRSQFCPWQAIGEEVQRMRNETEYDSEQEDAEEMEAIRAKSQAKFQKYRRKKGAWESGVKTREKEVKIDK